MRYSWTNRIFSLMTDVSILTLAFATQNSALAAHVLIYTH